MWVKCNVVIDLMVVHVGIARDFLWSYLFKTENTPHTAYSMLVTALPEYACISIFKATDFKVYSGCTLGTTVHCPMCKHSLSYQVAKYYFKKLAIQRDKSLVYIILIIVIMNMKDIYLKSSVCCELLLVLRLHLQFHENGYC